MPVDHLSATFAALADPTRRAILGRLVLGETSVNELAEPFRMSLPGISKHLKVLERILEPEKLVFTSRAFPDASGHAQLVVHNTVTFANDNGKTRLTLSAMILKATPEVTGPLQGMEQGWSQSLDRLAEMAGNL